MRRFIITLIASSIILVSPAKADSPGAIVGGVIGGMMLGAMAGAAASKQHLPTTIGKACMSITITRGLVLSLLRVRRILIRLIRA